MADVTPDRGRDQGFWQGSSSNPYFDIPGDALEDDGSGDLSGQAAAARPPAMRPPAAPAPAEAPSPTIRRPSARPAPVRRRPPQPLDSSGEFRRPRHVRPESEVQPEDDYDVVGTPRHQTVIAPPLPPRPTIRGASMAGTDRLARAEAARRALDTDAYFVEGSRQPRKGRIQQMQAVRRPAIERSKLHFWRWFRTLPIVVMALFGAASIVVSLGLFGIDRWLYPVDYNDTINAMAEAYGVDPYLVSAVIRTESGWNPDAVSRVGAVGLMQLLPGTATDLAASGAVDASRYDPSNLLDPETNIAYGTAYLRDCIANTGDLDQAIAAYNAGIAAAQGWAQSGTPFEEAIQYPETTAYLERVKQNLERYQQTYPDGIPSEEEAASTPDPIGVWLGIEDGETE